MGRYKRAVEGGWADYGDEIAFALGEWLSQQLCDWLFPETDDHPSARNVMFFLRNVTKEDLHDGAVAFQPGSEFWEKQPAPIGIKAMSSNAWVATNHLREGSKVSGSMWYYIGDKKGQINMDFGNHPTSKNEFQTYTKDDGGKYTAYCRGSNERNARFEIFLGEKKLYFSACDDSVLMQLIGYQYNDREVFGPWIHDSPASVVYDKNGALYCFFHGDNSPQSLWWMSFDGQYWTKEREALTQKQIDARAKMGQGGLFSADYGHHAMNSSPAAVNWKGTIVVFYQGAYGGGNDELWGAWMDGTDFKDFWHMGNSRLTSSPAAVVYRDTLWVLWQGAGNAGTLWCKTLGAAEGAQWTEEFCIRSDSIMSNAPSAIVWNDKLYVFFQGGGQNETLNYMSFDGNKWSEPNRIDGVGMSGSPNAMLTKDNIIRIYHQSSGKSGHLWYHDFEAKRGDIPVVCIGMSDSPSVVRYGDNYVCIHQGYENNKKLYSCFLPMDH